jgi:hypothetical protein
LFLLDFVEGYLKFVLQEKGREIKKATQMAGLNGEQRN